MHQNRDPSSVLYDVAEGSLASIAYAKDLEGEQYDKSAPLQRYWMYLNKLKTLHTLYPSNASLRSSYVDDNNYQNIAISLLGILNDRQNRIYDKTLASEAIKKISTIPVNAWNSDMVIQIIFACFKYQLDSNIMDVLAIIDSTSAENFLDDLLSTKSLVVLIGHFSAAKKFMNVQYCYKLSHRMRNKDIIGETILENAYLSACIENNKIELAKEKYSRMIEHGFADTSSRSIMMTHFASLGDIDECSKIWQSIEISNVSLHNNDITSCKSQYVKCILRGDGIQRAIEFVKDTQTLGLIESVSSILYFLGTKRYEPSFAMKILYGVVTAGRVSVVEARNSVKLNDSEVLLTKSLVINLQKKLLNFAEKDNFSDPVGSLFAGYLAVNYSDAIIVTFLGAYPDSLDGSISKLIGYIPSNVSAIETIYTLRSLNIYLSAVRQVIAASVTRKRQKDNQFSSSKFRDWPTPQLWKQTLAIFQSFALSSVDSYSITIALDIATFMNDFINAKAIWNIAKKTPITESIISSYLRCFVSSSHLDELNKIVPLDFSFPKSRRWDLGFISVGLRSRVVDEIIQAYLRTSGLQAAISICSSITQSSDRKTLSNAPITNMLIYFDRYWRDYNVDTAGGSSDPSMRNMLTESDALVKCLTKKVDDAVPAREGLKWAALASCFIARGLWAGALAVFRAYEDFYGRASNATLSISRAATIAIFSAVDAEIPLLTSTANLAFEGLKASASSSSISTRLASIPQRYRLRSASNRISCSAVDIVTFLEAAASSTNYRIPLDISFLDSLYIEMISSGKYADAARVVKILQKARLVVDVDPTYLFATNEPESESTGAGIVPTVDQVRVRLAQKWAAQLLGSSLNRLKTDLTDSIIKISSKYSS